MPAKISGTNTESGRQDVTQEDGQEGESETLPIKSVLHGTVELHIALQNACRLMQLLCTACYSLKQQKALQIELDI